jgi:hypothetical protein
MFYRRSISLVGGIPLHWAVALLAPVLVTAPIAADDSPLRQLVVALTDPAGPKAAREWFDRLPAAGPERTLGIYAMSLHLAQAGDCAAARDLLASLAGTASNAVPVLRMRLYLALESGDDEAARWVSESLVKVLPQASLASSEAVLMARMLGALAGSSDDNSPLGNGDWSKIEDALSGRSEEEHCLNHYRAAQKKAQNRKAVLIDFAKSLGSNEPAILMELQHSLLQECEGLTQELDAEEENLKAAIAARRKEKERVGTLAAKHNKWTAESRKPTPGKPILPDAPAQPGMMAGKTTEATETAYQAAVDRYENALRDYEVQLVVFRRTLQLWAQKDRARRELIARTLEGLKPELEDAREQEKNLSEEVVALRKKLADLHAWQDEKAAALRLVQLLGSSGTAPDRLLCRPSLYGALSLESEQQRLLQLIKR